MYAVTPLEYRHAAPGLLAVWIQGHWGIENRIHHVRDVTRGEERSRIRAGSGPHVLATLRNAALNLHRLEEHTNIARAQRRTAWRAGAALHTLNAG